MIRRNSSSSLIGENDIVVCYPTFGSRDQDGGWRLNIAGTVYQTAEVNLSKRILIRLLQRVMNVDPQEVRTEIFERRIERFVAATEHGKQIHIRLGDHEFRLPKRSKRNGLFLGTIHLKESDVRNHVDGQGWLHYQLVADHCVCINGRIRLIEPQGISIVSDIDDTIKHTEVTNRRALLANTFLREFRPIDGMAQLYRLWAQQGAEFHYVSSSPWQLFDALHELCDQSSFPNGTIHLRSFRLRDHMLRRLLLIRRKGKGATIRRILEKFPERQFVLVGDSGEKDASIYGNLARSFPGQIRHIYIRDLEARPMTELRCRKDFRNLGPECWTLFRCPSELGDGHLQNGVSARQLVAAIPPV